MKMKNFFYAMLVVVVSIGCNSKKNIVVVNEKVVERDKRLLVSHEVSFSSLYENSMEVRLDSKLKKKEEYFIPKKLYEYSKVSSMTISGGYLVDIDINENLFQILSEISLFKNLIELKIYNSEIENIPKSISYIHNLEKLNLTGNKVMDISSEISYLNNLTLISLENNDLGRLSDREINHLFIKLSLIKNLETLILSDNFLEKIPNNIKYITSLKNLYLSYNYLECFPCVITELPNLKYLSIDFSGELLLFPECIDNFPKDIEISLHVKPQDIDTYNREEINQLITRYPNVKWSAP